MSPKLSWGGSGVAGILQAFSGDLCSTSGDRMSSEIRAYAPDARVLTTYYSDKLPSPCGMVLSRLSLESSGPGPPDLVRNR
ncbi:hypothetical protein SDJN02_01478, partial [Cucurbita argyrosperma subsp. argyrosperma]